MKSIANIRRYGMLFLNDYEPSLDGESKLMAYYAMPLNTMSLLSYFNSKRDWYRIDAVLDVGFQLINIINDIHETGYCYNNLKPENVMVNDGTVTLVGFGKATKTFHNPFKVVQRSRNKDYKPGSTIDQSALWIASAQEDISSIYAVMT